MGVDSEGWGWDRSLKSGERTVRGGEDSEGWGLTVRGGGGQ